MGRGEGKERCRETGQWILSYSYMGRRIKYATPKVSVRPQITIMNYIFEKVRKHAFVSFHNKEMLALT